VTASVDSKQAVTAVWPFCSGLYCVHGRGAGVGRIRGIGVILGVGVGDGVGLAVGLGVGVGLAVAVAVAVGVGLGVRLGRGEIDGRGEGVGNVIAVGVGVGVNVAVAVGLGIGPDCAQYMPPLSESPYRSIPPQTIISFPIQTAVWKYLSSDALPVMLVALQLSVLGLYLPPVLNT
jgi:hypothetical protein